MPAAASHTPAAEVAADVAALEAQARALIASDAVTGPTRAALTARMAPAGAGGALDPAALATLAAVAARLLPLGALGEALDLARRFDHQLATGPGDGWRYADMPPDAQAHAQGLAALEAAAQAAHGGGFTDLTPDRQDALLGACQAGDPPGPAWPLPPARWFEEVLAALVELAYADPRVQLQIGYTGFADAAGWQGAPLAAAVR